MITVLVFPSTNEPGLEVAQALVKSNKMKVLGGSSVEREFDPSRFYLDRHVACPAYGEEGFAAAFRAILDDEDVDLVFPTVDSLVAEFSTWDVPGTTFITPEPDTAFTVLSKRRTYERLEGAVPLPVAAEALVPEWPAFAKPEIGSGSRGGFVIEDEQTLDMARRRGLLIQEYLPGDEYTVDCVGDRDGALLSLNVRRRAVVGRGIALAGKAVSEPEIEDHVRAISRRLPIAGPWFAQFKKAVDGTPKLIEINARVAGSMALTRLSGVNIPLISAFVFAGFEVKVPRAMPGVVVSRSLRTWGEINDFDAVIWDLDDTLLRKDGKVDPDSASRLYDFHNQGIVQYLLTKHPAPEESMARFRIPQLFADVRWVDDKVAEVAALLCDHNLDPSRCIMINDSMSERLAIEDAYPTLRVVMPDALDVLKRERVR